MDKDSTPIIRDLYPDLNEAELAEAEDQLERYLALVLRIFERVELERYPQPDPLTYGTGTLASTHARPESSGEVNSST